MNARVLGVLLCGTVLLAGGCGDGDSGALGPGSRDQALERETVAGETGRLLDELVSRYADYGLSGAVLVARGDAVLLHKGYGLADRERARPNTVGTRFPALSLTKPFVAMALLRLEERGAVRVDEPLETFFGRFPDAKREATLHHLLTHTAGLAVAGSERRYSNAGYSLAAAVIEQVTGESWRRVVRHEIFVPAGMVDSGFMGEPSSRAVAVGYRGPLHALEPMSVADGPPAMRELWWGAAGAAGIETTVADLYRWLRALARGELLGEASREQMFTAHVGDQGYGWHVDATADGHPRRWKGGGLPMYESQVVWYPEGDWMIVFALNDHVGWRVPLWTGLEDVLFDRELPLPPAVVPAGATGLASLAGRYRLAGGGAFDVRVEPEERVLLTAADEKAARALGFGGRGVRAGAVLVARPTGEGRFAGVHVRPGRARLPVVELRRVDELGQPALVLETPAAVEHRASRVAPRPAR